ncbi:hypothetical protein DXG01_011811 [Tephrocybe rancida]|nr:hypothetical protein DXG01_011811 [Tephrocybe rancida]
MAGHAFAILLASHFNDSPLLLDLLSDSTGNLIDPPFNVGQFARWFYLAKHIFGQEINPRLFQHHWPALEAYLTGPALEPVVILAVTNPLALFVSLIYIVPLCYGGLNCDVSCSKIPAPKPNRRLSLTCLPPAPALVIEGILTSDVYNPAPADCWAISESAYSRFHRYISLPIYAESQLPPPLPHPAHCLLKDLNEMQYNNVQLLSLPHNVLEAYLVPASPFAEQVVGSHFAAAHPYEPTRTYIRQCDDTDSRYSIPSIKNTHLMNEHFSFIDDSNKHLFSQNQLPRLNPAIGTTCHMHGSPAEYFKGPTFSDAMSASPAWDHLHLVYTSLMDARVGKLHAIYPPGPVNMHLIMSTLNDAMHIVMDEEFLQDYHPHCIRSGFNCRYVGPESDGKFFFYSWAFIFGLPWEDMYQSLYEHIMTHVQAYGSPRMDLIYTHLTTGPFTFALNSMLLGGCLQFLSISGPTCTLNDTQLTTTDPRNPAQPPYIAQHNPNNQAMYLSLTAVAETRPFISCSVLVNLIAAMDYIAAECILPAAQRNLSVPSCFGDVSYVQYTYYYHTALKHTAAFFAVKGAEQHVVSVLKPFWLSSPPIYSLHWQLLCNFPLFNAYNNQVPYKPEDYVWDLIEVLPNEVPDLSDISQGFVNLQNPAMGTLFLHRTDTLKQRFVLVLAVQQYDKKPRHNLPSD